MRDDVLIVGAGPAGAVAATLLARTGARVRLLDRARFPRDKLCGDTVNPGTLAALRRFGMAGALDSQGLRIDGMVVTEGGVTIEGRYPDGLHGRALVRRELDWALIDQARAAGVQFEPDVAVRRALIDTAAAQPAATGVVVAVRGSERTLRSRVVIAADGRRSTIAFGLGLARHPLKPRRWAIGAYFANVPRTEAFGEMHVRRGGYIGVAPLPGGLTNVCLVRPSQPADGALRGAGALLRGELARDPLLADRFLDAQLLAPPVVLGPLAVDYVGPAIHGLLLAGDAAGFVDPMTGDGLRFAIRGGELAAVAARQALDHGWEGVHRRLGAERQREFAAKLRLNRVLRALVASPNGSMADGAVSRWSGHHRETQCHLPSVPARFRRCRSQDKRESPRAGPACVTLSDIESQR